MGWRLVLLVRLNHYFLLTYQIFKIAQANKMGDSGTEPGCVIAHILTGAPQSSENGEEALQQDVPAVQEGPFLLLHKF